ncbi:MAG: hypothetical protein K2N34_07880 [Lachnospiraceae bacterium]|nr:hypothetical protein [Lachnospiraceae bacterium]
MAKKNNDNENINDILGDSAILGTEPEKENKAASVLITALIIIIWLGIFAALIKFDVMGFGSNVLAPVLKDVPVLNKILPNGAGKETDDDIPYKSIAECAAYIKELENELADYQQAENDKDAKIADLQAEVARLKQFEDNQTAFEELRAKFYEEVVFGENAPDVSNYVEYYQAIDKENADLLYQRALEKYAYDQQVIERAKYYSSMKPAKAAKIFCEMTGDLDIIVALLNSMSAEDSGAIIAAISDIDSVFAAKVTKKLMP